jgi:hypothetical protein
MSFSKIEHTLAERKNRKKATLQIIDESPLCSALSSAKIVTQRSQRLMAGMPDHDMMTGSRAFFHERDDALSNTFKRFYIHAITPNV